MTVIKLDEHRDQSSYDGASCVCGEGWFSLRAVCMTKEGKVTGYAGQPRCVSCGSPYPVQIR